MRIAWVLPGGVDRGGTRRVIPSVLWLLERFAREAHVDVFALRQEDHASRYALKGATVHAIGRPVPRLGAASALWAEHRRRPFDVVYASGGLEADVVASVTGRILGIPTVIQITGGELASIPEISYGGCLHRRGRVWLKLALDGATQILALSEPIRAQVEALGYPAVRMPFGVDLGAWPLREPRPRPSHEPARLLHVASLNRVKDQGTLLGAAAILREGGLSFRLDVVGEDTLGGAVQARAGDLGLAEHIHFHGFLTNDRVRTLMESAHLLMVSSRHEGGPMVAVEAAVTGVPTVGTDVGFLHEWAPEGAVTVRPADPGALARATAELLGDDERRMRMARAARARALAEDADRCAARLLEIFAGLLVRRVVG